MTFYPSNEEETDAVQRFEASGRTDLGALNNAGLVFVAKATKTGAVVYCICKAIELAVPVMEKLVHNGH
jgi:hypothetical protein